MMDINWYFIIGLVLYGILGVLLGAAKVHVRSWKFWGILAVVMAIDVVSALEATAG